MKIYFLKLSSLPFFLCDVCFVFKFVNDCVLHVNRGFDR